MVENPRDEAFGDVLRHRLEALLGSPWNPAHAEGASTEPSRVESPPPEETDSEAAPTREVVGVARRGFGGAVGRGLAFGRQHLVVVAIVALSGCLWAGYSMTQARSHPVMVASMSPAPLGSVTPSGSEQTPLQVHVLGAVRTPGVVRLAQGSRVQDALEAAGGLTDQARPGELNMAAVVSDGSQILIGTTAKPGGQVRGATDAGSGSGVVGEVASRVNLNSATVEQLDTLPGVGPVTAQAIVSWRTKHTRFTRIEELQEVDGIGPKTYAELAPKVTV